MLKAGFRVLTDIKKIVDAENKRTLKAASTALKREGFLLAAELRKDIKAGRAGNQAFPKLSSMARRYAGKFQTRKPFTKLDSTRKASGPSKGIVPIRYNPVTTTTGLRVDVGLVDTRQEKMSKNWIRIFRRQQGGFSQAITATQRRALATIGGTMPKRSKLRKHFFLRKGTTRLKTPARPIIDPFFSKWRVLSSKRIEENFHKKMMGERI